MTHTTQHNAATLHAALMAAATLAPEYQNNEIGKASRDVSNASQLRAVYFDDGLIDRIQYAQRMGWKETQGEWLIQTTTEETYSELAATCDQRPSHVTVKTATGRLKLVNTRNRLQGFADEVARSKASWALWGGGNMPAELAKPRKAKPTTTWHTTSINVCVQCFEDKQFSDGLAMALGKLGAVAYWHQDNPKNEPFLMLAPQPVEGMPARLVSGRHAIGGEWVVFDTVSGYSIKGYKAARSRAAAERAALDAWKEKTPAQIDAALNRVTANDTTKALARLCELWKVEDAAEALADAQAKAEALAADAEAQALAADAVAPVADVAPVAPVADVVAEVVADALAAAAIETAQTTACADELAQVATVADAVACVADELACVADELACVADAVACMPRSEHCGQPPSHTPTGAGFATPGSSQPTASQAGKSGGQRIAGKSGKWVATFHTTPAGLPGMVYTDADGQAQAHEFASGAERMATLQRLARMADAQPATAANVAHLAAFDPSGVDVWQCSTREVQAMAEADFVALVQHLENVNHHTAALCAKCLRAGCDDLAEACTRLENAHVQAGQLTPALALARFTIGRLLRGESVNMAEAGAGSGLDACEVSEAVALVGNAYPPTKAAATPHTPPASAADAQATPPVCPAGAPNYTDPLKTLGIDYTQPLKTLAVPPATPTDWQALVGAGVTYTGDACNAPGHGAIVAVNETPCGRAAWLTVDVMLEDGRHPKGLRLNAFGDKPGYRYRLRPMLHGAPYLAQLAAAVAMREANRTATKAMADKAHADTTARLAVEFAHLERAENNHRGGTFAARNIRTELKRAFQGVKFSVTSDYSSVRVKWTDGPTDAQVNEVIGRFSTGASDTQIDYFYTIETAFSKLFGGVQYLFTSRETSEAFTADVLAAWWPTRGESATQPTPTAQDWKKGEGLFSWRTGSDHLRDAFRKHLRETAGPTPTPAKATRKAKA